MDCTERRPKEREETKSKLVNFVVAPEVQDVLNHTGFGDLEAEECQAILNRKLGQMSKLCRTFERQQ